MSTEYIFKGFWSPTVKYSKNDLVLYYSLSGYDTLALYKFKKDSTALSCPLKYFAYPVLTISGAAGANYAIEKTVDDDYTVYRFTGSTKTNIDTNLDYEEALKRLREKRSEGQFVYLTSRNLRNATPGGWTDSEYYHDSLWLGPNGNTSDLEINSDDWGLADLADSEISSSNWSNLLSYQDILSLNPQQFDSKALTTLSLGKYGTSDDSASVSFDEIQGETDSDAYYISTVQNYKGNFEPGESYEQFDVVRNPDSKRFIYAKEDISQPDEFETGDTIIMKNVIIEPPIENVENSKHVGTLRLGPNGTIQINSKPAVNKFITLDGNNQVFHINIGNVLSFEDSVGIIKNNRKFSVVGVGEDMVYLGAYGADLSSEGFGDNFGLNFGSIVLVENWETNPSNSSELIPWYAGVQDFHGDYNFTIKREAVGVNLSTADHELWSTDEFFFDADYGSTVEYKAKNKIFDYGDGYQSVSPLGVNSLRVNMNLNFSNRSSREANCILHFLENNLGQHENDLESEGELEYNQGISGFKMGGDSLFFPYRNNENLTRKFYCFDFGHEMQNEDVHAVNAQIMNTDLSTLSVAEQMFVNRAEPWNDDTDYVQHSVVFCPENLKYYYSYTDGNNRSFRPYVSTEDDNSDPQYAGANQGIKKINSINKNLWTREFYWKPSIPLTIPHEPAIQENSSKASAYAQYFPKHKININNLALDLKFENRSNQEAYAILHFLETHLGYLSFLFTPPAPYNRKRRFYCEGWKHTYVFKNNHTIEAKFIQYPLGQNTPLDDDQVDQILSPSPPNPGELKVEESINFIINKPETADKLYLKKSVKLENTGGTSIEISSIVFGDQSTKFTKSDVGIYKNKLEPQEAVDSHVNNTSTGGSYYFNTSAESNGGSVFTENTTATSAVFTQDAEGRVFQDGKFLVVSEQNKTLIKQDLLINPGEERFLEIYYTADLGERYTDTINIEYAVGSSAELFWVPVSAGYIKDLSQNTVAIENVISAAEYNSLSTPEQLGYQEYKPAEKTYLKNNIIQYDREVYKVTQDFNSSADFNDDYPGKLAKYYKNKTITVNAFVNEDMIDDRKNSLYVNIDETLDEDSFFRKVDVRSMGDNLDYHKNAEGVNLYNNIAYNAATDGASLFAPSIEEDFLEIYSSTPDSFEYVLTNIYWNGTKYTKYGAHDLSDPDEIPTVAGIFYSTDTTASDVIAPGSNIDGVKWGTNLHASGMLVIKFPEFLSIKDGWVDSTSSKEKIEFDIIDISKLHEFKIDGYIVEEEQSSGDRNSDLASLVRQSSEIGDLNLEDCSNVSVFLSGYFTSQSKNYPALELGGPWHESVKLNIYIGNAEWEVGTDGHIHLSDVIKDSSVKPTSVDPSVYTCDIIGAGGAGGSAMVSEGNIYENGVPLSENENYITATAGEDGGGALYINGVDEDAEVKIYFLEHFSRSVDESKPDFDVVVGNIKGGGGGGAGGSYNQIEKRIKTRTCANFAGGGGGGAPFGEGGAFNGTNAGIVTPGYGGAASNNDLNIYTHLSAGAKGGYFGEDGGDILDDNAGKYDAWEDNKSYGVNDWVKYEDRLFRCVNIHTSSPVNAPSTSNTNNTNWEFVSSFILVPGGKAGYAIKVEDSFVDIKYYTYSIVTNTSTEISTMNDDLDFIEGNVIDV